MQMSVRRTRKGSGKLQGKLVKKRGRLMGETILRGVAFTV